MSVINAHLDACPFHAAALVLVPSIPAARLRIIAVPPASLHPGQIPHDAHGCLRPFMAALAGANTNTETHHLSALPFVDASISTDFPDRPAIGERCVSVLAPGLHRVRQLTAASPVTYRPAPGSGWRFLAVHQLRSTMFLPVTPSGLHSWPRLWRGVPSLPTWVLPRVRAPGSLPPGWVPGGYRLWLPHLTPTEVRCRGYAGLRPLPTEAGGLIARRRLPSPTRLRSHGDNEGFLVWLRG